MRAKSVVPAAVALGVAIAIGTVIASELAGVRIGMFTRDIQSLSASGGLALPHYAGALSMLTIMVWTAGSALAFAAAALVPARRSWLLVLGGLLLVIAADDAFMLHEGLGLPEVGFVIVYGVVAGWLAFRSLAHHRDGSGTAMLVGGAALALSAALDRWATDPYLLEDHFKLIGALVLLTIGPTMIAPMLSDRPAEPIAGARQSRAKVTV
ncbi:hypothetical protein [Marisediminicola antarctica]|uniref:hypothetical protein n=1 Tax=Marisediminicola antarctica TaxID=674079 RepID=UPI00137A01F4|nr:hypothetical protein [Marisediminicola antarctica]